MLIVINNFELHAKIILNYQEFQNLKFKIQKAEL